MPLSPSELLATRSLSDELPCRNCGYILRGLDPAGNCPECGRPISASMSHSLAYANLAWLATLARGLRLAWMAILAGIITWAGAFALNVIVTELGIIATALCLPPLLSGVAAWLITTPEPQVDSRPTGIGRWSVRVTATLGFAGQLPLVLSLFPHFYFHDSTVFFFLLGSMFSRAIATGGVLYYIERLYRRVPFAHGADRAAWFRRWLLVNLIGAIALAFFAYLTGGASLAFCGAVLWICSVLAWLFCLMLFYAETTIEMRETLEIAKVLLQPRPPA